MSAEILRSFDVAEFVWKAICVQLWLELLLRFGGHSCVLCNRRGQHLSILTCKRANITMSVVTPLEHTLMGAAGGVLEVCVMQPMVGIKNALQEGRPVPRNPLHLYRGLTINAVSIAPITATQFGTNRLVEGFLAGSSQRHLSNIEKFASAGVSGAVSALVASPSELIIIQQQKSGRTLLAETSLFFKTYSASSIFRGLMPCIGRETVYAAGYLGLCPVLKEVLESKGYSPATAMAISGVTGGVFAAACSHPFDTMKTRMQAFMYSKPEYMTSAKTAQTIFSEGGILCFWRGLAPRMTRIIAATFILNQTRNRGVAYLEEQRLPK